MPKAMPMLLTVHFLHHLLTKHANSSYSSPFPPPILIISFHSTASSSSSSSSSMAFQFQHLKHSINDTLEAICQVSCNPSNDSGFCLAPCWEICPSVCVNPFSHHPPLSPPPHNSTSPTKLLLILFTVLASASLALLIYFCYAKRRRRNRGSRPPPLITTQNFVDEDHGPVVDHPIWYIRTVGLQASVIDSIAVFRYKKGDGLVELTDCSVCLSEFQEDEVLRLLPKCSHAFHIPSVDTWLRSHTNCPVCRAPVVLPPPRQPST